LIFGTDNVVPALSLAGTSLTATSARCCCSSDNVVPALSFADRSA